LSLRPFPECKRCFFVFFDRLPVPANAQNKTPDAPLPSYASPFLATSDGLSLAKAFTRIKRTGLRRSMVHLVEEIAAEVAP
jgi:hypothetical protein